MSRMRFIGTSLDKGYRDDLNYNFGLLEALIGESNGLTEALRQEMLEKIYNLQTQIDMLTGENIGELLARLNDAIQQALTAAQEARTAKTATEEATALAIAAKELAIASATLADEKAVYAEEKAILAQEAADNANQEAANLGQMKVAVVQATQDANTATSNANQATEEAQIATNAINVVLPNVTGLENLQEWSDSIAYKKNNFVTFEGNGYMALQNNINISPPSFPVLSNDDWAMLVQKGEKGEQGTGVRILGTLVNESELPPIGEPGDAYLINGDLYVWSDTTDDWTNVGTIKGPKGDQGIQGPKGDKGDKGDPGEDADVEAINQQIGTLRTEITAQLDQLEQTTENHLTDNNKHFVGSEKISFNSLINRLGSKSKIVSSWDNALENGFYVSSGNAPTSDWFIGIVTTSDTGDAIIQRVAPYGQPVEYVRTRFINTWSSWRKVLNQDDYDTLFTLFGDKNVKIASAISDKGVPTSADATSDQMAANIRAIPTGVKKAEFDLQTSSVILDGGTGTITTPVMNFQPMNATNTMIGTSIFRGMGGDISQSTVINGIAYVEKCTINNIGNGNYTVTFTIKNRSGAGVSLPIGTSLRTTITG